MEGSSVKNMFCAGRRIFEMWNAGRKLWEQKIISTEKYFYVSSNFTIPQNVVSMKITLAGGGGGAGGAIGAVYVWGGGGGGGGGRVVKTFSPTELDAMRGQSFAVIVGAAGLHQGDNQWGAPGGTSQFQCPGLQPTAFGGNGGQTGAPGAGGAGTGGENGDEILSGGNGGSGSVGGGRGGGGHGQGVGDVSVAGTHGCGWGGGGGMPTGYNGAQGAVWIQYSYYE